MFEQFRCSMKKTQFLKNLKWRWEFPCFANLNWNLMLYAKRKLWNCLSIANCLCENVLNKKSHEEHKPFWFQYRPLNIRTYIPNGTDHWLLVSQCFNRLHVKCASAHTNCTMCVCMGCSHFQLEKNRTEPEKTVPIVVWISIEWFHSGPIRAYFEYSINKSFMAINYKLLFFIIILLLCTVEIGRKIFVVISVLCLILLHSQDYFKCDRLVIIMWKTRRMQLKRKYMN